MTRSCKTSCRRGWGRPLLFNFPPGSIDSQVTHSLFLLSQVAEVIHPRFLAQLLSPEAQLDVLALAEDLGQEKRLTPVQVSQWWDRT